MKRIAIFCFIFFYSLISFAQQTEIQYLSGRGNNDTKTWEFFCTNGRNGGKWSTIQVPSCWEQQGYGNYNYGRDYKTYGKNYRMSDEEGFYKYKFAVPNSWKSKDVWIVFEASMTDTDVKVNGKKVGPTHRGAFYQFEYDISSFLKFDGKNELEVSVKKMSEDASVNNAERLADYWIFGGIFRPVYLKALPIKHIQRLSIKGEGDGNFNARIQLNKPNLSGNAIVSIKDLKGKQIAILSSNIQKGDSVIELYKKIDNIKSWNSESPNLYNAEVQIVQNGKIIHRLTVRFGFRTIEIRKGDGIFINNVKVKMKGVNRHCFWPETGRTLNDSIQLQDALLIKGMNMNAVRCSHYPPDKYFLDLCDSLGLYVLDELTGWQKYYSTSAGTPLVKELVLRDENHPSIIFWDNGNEGGTNKALDPLFDYWDYSKRPVIHPHHRPGNDINGIDCDHYEDYYSTLNKFKNDTLIYMPTEFQHAQDDGGAASGMEDIWNIHWKARNSGGCFIWALVDEGIMRTDRNNQIDNNGSNANDGILGPHREKEGSYDALKSIFSPIQMELDTTGKKYSLSLENRFHYTNLNECSFKWYVVKYHSIFSKENGYEVIDSGTFVGPNLVPLDSTIVALPNLSKVKSGESLVINSYDNHGAMLESKTWQLVSHATILAKDFNIPFKSKPAVSDNDSTIILEGGQVKLVFEKKTGLLAFVENAAGNLFSFKNGPIPVDGVNKLIKYELISNDTVPKLKCFFEGPIADMTWSIDSSGKAKLAYSYSLHKDVLFGGGISFDYPDNYMLSVRWLGKGPYRQWKNRVKGSSVNVWENMYNNTETSRGPLIYPEFKGYFGDLVWMEFNTVEGMFYVATEDNNVNVRLFDFYGVYGENSYPRQPNGKISFLDYIPPMGSVMSTRISANTGRLGPQSEWNNVNGTFNRSLYFYFGYPPIIKTKEKYSRPEVDNVF